MTDRTVDPGLYACLSRPRRGTDQPPEANDQRRSINDDRPTTADPHPLVAIAAEFSPRYERHGADLVSIDLRGLSRLFGTPRRIGEELRREAAARGVHVHVALAPTRTAALVLALARPGLTVVTAADQAAELAIVPLNVLELVPPDSVPTVGITVDRPRVDDAAAPMPVLKRWGLRTLGELAALPAGDLSARLGRAGRLWQAIARGEDTRPLVPMQPEERFDASLDLEWPIDGAEPLSFVLTRLLEPLSTRLERRDRGAAVLHVALRLVTRDVHVCRLELPSPLREVRALRTLALLDFEAHPPAAAIDRVTVTIEPTPGRILQHALFARPHPTPEQLSTLVARLGALMGQDRVGAPAAVDSYRPGAFAMAPFAVEHIQVASRQSQVPGRQSNVASQSDGTTQSHGADTGPRSPVPGPRSALRRCRQPVPARVTEDPHHRPLRVSSDRRAFPGGAVVACAGPWRTSGAWWEDNGWSRDEWDVALADSAVYRVFRDRASGAWFIDALVD